MEAKRQRVINTIIVLAAVVALSLAIFIRVRLLDMPLERDEGEFAYAAQILLQGASPYQHAYNAMLKLPGTCVGYAAFMALLGQTASSIHIGVTLIAIANSLLVFMLARRICGTAGAAIAAIVHSFIGLSPVMQGLAAHASHFIMLPALVGAWLLCVDRITPGRLFAAGLCFGLATLMKQSGAAFLVFGATWLCWREMALPQRNIARAGADVAWLFGGAALPGIGLVVMLFITGDLDKFWFWTVRYAAAHGRIIDHAQGLQTMREALADQLTAAPLVWATALVGVVVVAASRAFRLHRSFVALFGLWSLLTVFPGWFFRGHYFLQLAPAISVLCGITFAAAISFRPARNIWTALAVIGALLIASSVLLKEKRIYFELLPPEACRAIYGTNPFPEAAEIGEYLRTKCPERASIAVIGSEPEIYFYSRRRSATPYICTYPMLEPQPYAAAMRAEMIEQVENANAEFVVFVNEPMSWIQAPGAVDRTIFDWFNTYQRERLRLVAAAEVLPDGRAAMRWYGDQRSFPPLPESYTLALFQKL